MRISDWSSDVCSSDLVRVADAYVQALGLKAAAHIFSEYVLTTRQPVFRSDRKATMEWISTTNMRRGAGWNRRFRCRPKTGRFTRVRWPAWKRSTTRISLRSHVICGAARRSRISAISSRRSEEHTYELQSLLSISYTVFLLKKK